MKSQPKMVWLLQNEKQTYWLKSRSQMWPLGLTLAMTLTLNCQGQGQIWNLLYLNQKCPKVRCKEDLPDNDRGDFRCVLSAHLVCPLGVQKSSLIQWAEAHLVSRVGPCPQEPNATNKPNEQGHLGPGTGCQEPKCRGVLFPLPVNHHCQMQQSCHLHIFLIAKQLELEMTSKRIGRRRFWRPGVFCRKTGVNWTDNSTTKGSVPKELTKFCGISNQDSESEITQLSWGQCFVRSSLRVDQGFAYLFSETNSLAEIFTMLR